MVRDRRIPPDTRLAGSTPCLIVGVHRDQHLALDMAAPARCGRSCGIGGRRSKACYENRMAGCGLMHLAHTADTRTDVIFIDNGAPEVLVGCYENRMAGCGLMHLAHTADTRADVIFIDNGAPEVLVGCQGGNRGEVWGCFSSATIGI